MTTPTDSGHSEDVLGGLLAQRGPGMGGHGPADPLRPTADVSVRPALPEDAPALGDLHARTLRATLTAGTGAELGPAVSAAIDAQALAASWSAAITAPPSPRHRVLTAVAGAQVVGFAAIAPAERALTLTPDPAASPGRGDALAAADTPNGSAADTSGGGVGGTSGGGVGGAPETGPVGEILALEVPAAHGRRGHGSRLLAACVDLLREQGAVRVQTWAVQGEESRARFLAEAGFAPAGLRRTLDLGGAAVVETCWWAAL